MSNSLPHAQKLFAQYEGDARVRVVAVATAFEKDTYPWMADEEKIRERLRAEGWKFSVMRDADEKIIHKFGVGGSAGTPTTIVLDRSGIVRWHGFNTSPETAGEVAKTVEELLDSFFVAPIASFLPDLQKIGRSYVTGKYGRAYSGAKKLLDQQDAAAATREQAQLILDNLERGVESLIEESAKRREAGYPSIARERLELAVRLFKSVPKADEADANLAAWKKDSAFQEELKGEKDLAKVEAVAENPKVDKEVIRKRLAELREKYAGTPIVNRIDRLLGSP